MGIDHFFTPSAIGRIAPDGVITLYYSVNAGFPDEIAPGADGNLWFTEFASASGTHPAIGRIGAGAPGPSLVAPSVAGTGEEGTEQVCQGDLWATWAGEQPVQNSPDASPPGVQWLRDGVPLVGETVQSYTPVAGDVGHLLSCTVAVTYPLLKVSASATSDPITVPPNTSIDSGPSGSTNDNTPTFSFSSDEQGASFECRLDSSQETDFQPCSSPHTTDPLSDGPHTFDVRAADALGNQDPTPDSRSFTIQPALAPPQPQEPQPSAPQPSAQPPFNLAKAIRKCRKKFEGRAERRCTRRAKAKARAEAFVAHLRSER
jgi:hypothetical protein